MIGLVARNSSFKSGLGYLLHFFLYSRLLMKAPQCSQVLLRCMSHVAGGVSTNSDVAPVLKPLTKIMNARRPASGTIALPSMPKRSESCLLLVFTIRSLTGAGPFEVRPVRQLTRPVRPGSVSTPTCALTIGGTAF